MAVYYAVEFPLEDSKSQGPHSVPDNKVKVQNGKTLVLWSVVDQNGDITEQYFEATNLKKGSKKEIGDFIDRLKKSREQALISNNGRSRKKPAKLDDYEDPDYFHPQAGNKPPLKRPRKALFHEGVGNGSADEAEDDQDSDDLDGTAVLAKWQQNVTARKCNDISRQNPPKKVKALKPNERPGDVSRVSKTAVKKAREEAADSQSRDISKILPLTMKIIRHSLNDGDEPVEFSMNVRQGSTFGAVRQQLAQMTGIATSDQILILKGEEWSMEDSEMITDVWSPQEFVAISAKNIKCIGEY